MTMGTELRALSGRAQVAALAPEWRALTDRSADASVFHTWEWVDTWLDHFTGSDRLHVVTVRRGGELAGLMPLVEMRYGVGAAATRLFLPAGQEHGDIGGPLLGPDPEPVAAALLDHLEGLVDIRSSVELIRVPDDSAFAAVLDERRWSRARPVPGSSATCPLLDLRAYEDPDEEIERRIRKRDVHRLSRRIAERHEVHFTPNDPTQETLDALTALHLRNWEGRPEAVSGLLATDAGRAFIADAMPRLDAAGHLRLGRLAADGRTVAVSLGYVVGNRFLGQKSAFDETFIEFGPGNMLLAHVMRGARQEGVEVIDLGRGDETYKMRWASDTRQVASSALVSTRMSRVLLTARQAMLSRRARRGAAAQPRAEHCTQDRTTPPA